MPFYHYKGPVLLFGKEVARNWEGRTFAPSQRKALSNLAYQYKNSNNFAKTAKISLDEKSIKED